MDYSEPGFDEPATSDFNDNTNRDFVSSLERGLRMIEALSVAPQGLTLSKAAEQTGLTRAAARRLLLTLCVLGYANRTEKTFALTPKILSIGGAYLNHVQALHHLEPLMRQISHEVNESCSLAILDGYEIVYVARIPANRIMSANLTIGARLPAFCTSLGRALLSQLPGDQVTLFLAASPKVKLTPHTVTDIQQLSAAVESARKTGYAFSDEEVELGMRSLAMPLPLANGFKNSAINVSTLASRMSMSDMIAQFGPVLKRAVIEMDRFAMR